jgi:hypothetical protein
MREAMKFNLRDCSPVEISAYEFIVNTEGQAKVDAAWQSVLDTVMELRRRGNSTEEITEDIGGRIFDEQYTSVKETAIVLKAMCRRAMQGTEEGAE